MRDRFLGDSLDMSKRAAVSLLRNAGFRVLVCPLPSQDDFSEKVYRSCLGMKEEDELFNPVVRFRATQREKHLNVLRDHLSNWKPEKPGIAILDPDKGVHESLKSNLFLTVEEIDGLVGANRAHVIAVYHHKNAGGISYLDLVARFTPRPAFAYDFGAAVLCFGHSEVGHLQHVRGVFSQLNPGRVLLNQALQQTVAAV